MVSGEFILATAIGLAEDVAQQDILAVEVAAARIAANAAYVIARLPPSQPKLGPELYVSFVFRFVLTICTKPVDSAGTRFAGTRFPRWF